MVLMKLGNDQNITFGAGEVTQRVKAVAVQVWCVQTHSKGWMCSIAIGRSEMEEERRLSKACGVSQPGIWSRKKEIRNPVSNQGGK